MKGARVVLEQAFSDAYKPIVDVGVVGGVLMLTVLALICAVMWIRKLYDTIEEKGQAHLEDVRKYAAEGEATRAVLSRTTAAQEANTETMKTVLELFRERMRN